MRRLFRRPVREEDLYTNKLEQFFGDSLIQMSPRTEFINDLKKRLVTNYPQDIETEVNRWGLFAVASLVSGIMLLVMGIRAVIMILSILGITGHYRQTINQKRSAELSSSS
jgi:hypothetical protein